MQIRTRTIATGILTRLPGTSALYRTYCSKPGPVSAMNCYGIWLKHLAAATTHGMRGIPRTLVELGPGSSIGVGLAALICGTERYYGLDAVPSIQRHRTLELFDEIVGLFRTRARPGNARGFPPYEYRLDQRGFPSDVLPRAYLNEMLDTRRLSVLRSQVRRFVSGDESDSCFHYLAPWSLAALHCCGEADLVMSHTVMQHVESPEDVWANVAAMLRDGGLSTMQISYYSHGITRAWNGHWGCSGLLWKIALGRKNFLINRIPHSRMLSAIEASGLDLLAVIRRDDPFSGIGREALNKDWRWITDEDLRTRDAFVVASKGASSLHSVIAPKRTCVPCMKPT